MYEVYICKLGDDTVYIGQGVKGRHKHCISGKSHVYELNEIFFSGQRNLLSVSIHSFVFDKKVAESIEKELIKNKRPRFNYVYLSVDRQKKANQITKFKSNMLKDMTANPLWFYSKDGVAYREVLDEFLRFHLYEDFMSQGFVLMGKNFYSKFGFKRLSNLVRKPYDPDSNCWKDVFKNRLLMYSGCNHFD